MLTLAEIALPFAERGEAETTPSPTSSTASSRAARASPPSPREYSRSDTAAQGGVLEPMPAARLPPAFRTQVLLLEPGRVTRPVPISGGVAIIKLVSIRQEMPPPRGRRADEPEAREALRQQLFTERITSFGQGYLQELLGDALIVER